MRTLKGRKNPRNYPEGRGQGPLTVGQRSFHIKKNKRRGKRSQLEKKKDDMERKTFLHLCVTYNIRGRVAEEKAVIRT